MHLRLKSDGKMNLSVVLQKKTTYTYIYIHTIIIISIIYIS